MRLLVFYPYIPYPPDRGAYHRAFQLLKALAAAHDVDLLALAENGDGLQHRAVFAQFCHRVEFVPFHHPPWPKLFPGRLLNGWPSTTTHWSIPAVAEKLDELLRATPYDAAHIEDIVLAQYFLGRHVTLPLISDRTRVDLFYQLMEQRHMGFSWRNRLLNLENLAKLWRYERAVGRRSMLEVVCGPDDERFLRRFIRPRAQIAVIPNGVDLDYFDPQVTAEIPRDPPPTLLFCGAMDYNPNVDAMRWYFAAMHQPLRRLVPNLRLLIVGKDPTPEVRRWSDLENVTVTGGVPDVRPFYRRAWAQIVPLRIGGGTRLKIVESLALGTPVISTTIGAQGLNLRHNEEILLADTAPNFVRECERLLKDSVLHKSLAHAGRRAVEARLSWPMLGKQLCDWYERLFGIVTKRPSVARNVDQLQSQAH